VTIDCLAVAADLSSMSHSSRSEALYLGWSSGDHLVLWSAGSAAARVVNVAHFTHVYGDAVVDDEVIWAICWLDQLCQDRTFHVVASAA